MYDSDLNREIRWHIIQKYRKGTEEVTRFLIDFHAGQMN